MIEGTYYKQVGGDSGIFWDGKKWHTFECLGCEYARGHIIGTQRLQTSYRLMAIMRRKIERRLAQGHARGYEFLHDAELHKNWLAAGKPHRMLE